MNARVELVGILSSSLWNKTRFDVASVVLSIIFQVYYQLVSIGLAYNAVEGLLACQRMSVFVGFLFTLAPPEQLLHV